MPRSSTSNRLATCDGSAVMRKCWDRSTFREAPVFTRRHLVKGRMARAQRRKWLGSEPQAVTDTAQANVVCAVVTSDCANLNNSGRGTTRASQTSAEPLTRHLRHCERLSCRRYELHASRLEEV